VKKLAALGKNAAPFPTRDAMVDLAYNHDLDPDEEWAGRGLDHRGVADLAMKAMDWPPGQGRHHRLRRHDLRPLRNGWVRAKYDLVIIDEAQDMNAAQLLLAMKVCKKGGRIAVVGDDRQAIYGFRGADSNSIDRLKGELVAHELGLTITYRCPKVVVAAAARLVPDYTAAPAAPEGEMLTATVEEMYTQAAVGDFILSRKNAPLAAICLHLLAMGKRAIVEGREIGAGPAGHHQEGEGEEHPRVPGS
jgi:hypothetical protein